MPARLILYRGNEKLGLELKDGVYRIGRDKPADIVIPDPTVSGNHAELQIQGRTFQIRDLGSTNGTFLNDTPVRAITPVKPTDQLRLGSVRVGIELVEEARPVEAPSRPASEAAAEKVAAVKRASSKLPWGLRYFLGGAAAIILLMILFMFVFIYTEQAAALRRQGEKYKGFAAQYMHVLRDPEVTEVPAPVVDSSLSEPLMIADRNGRILYPRQPPGSTEPSPFINSKTGQPFEAVKRGLTPYPSLAGPGEEAPISYPVQIGGDLLGFVMARPAPEADSDRSFVLLVLAFAGGFTLLCLYFFLRPTSAMLRREIEALRMKLSPYANGFIDDLPKSRTMPELGLLALEIEKEYRRAKNLTPDAVTMGAPQAGSEFLPMMMPLLDAAGLGWCFLDADFRIVGFNRDLTSINELAGATNGVSIFDTGLNSLQSKDLVRAISEARDSGVGRVSLSLSRDRKDARYDVSVKSIVEPSTRKQMFGLVFSRAA